MMKKLIGLFAFLIVAIGLQAQTDSTFYKVGTAPVRIITNDTITNTGTDYRTWTIKLPFNEPVGLACQMIAANVSGTTDIDVVYQSSLDGSTFYTVASDSLAANNLTYIHEDIDGFTGRYFRVTYTGVGTHVTKINGYLYVFKIPK